ncbi:ABC transporter substrate-binding protein [Roseomonas sp. NAR14]|uniref:ABC transporter substrate-binding protein n=1 Tax=Roseomonas acroporae TaxID=2937791 RepID=A0A9X1Y944_9PROT|nr:ABC transporter substrate-binding protein [Roseomonas acroporae]MCK8784382.1 ABC transporter substrate-binding protein [Roseomonas acroporae]
MPALSRRSALALGAAALATPHLANAQAGKLSVSVWGGSWRDLVASQVGRKFTAETGAPVEFVTGGTIDRLNKAKLAKGSPETDITFTTSHIGWLYANDGLFETLDLGRIPNAAGLVPQARISPMHVGAWSYVYTIGYRPDIVKDMAFESWADLWKPAMADRLAAPDWDPSHLIAVACKLEGVPITEWQRAQGRLRALRPSFHAFYTSDANGQQLIGSGETPVQVILSMNAHYMAAQGTPLRLAMPREGAVLGIDTVSVMQGSRRQELAYRFINTVLDPEVQAAIATEKKGSPTVAGARLAPEVASLPGIFTSAEQWNTQALVIDHRLRAEKTAEWRQWFQENIIAR